MKSWKCKFLSFLRQEHSIFIQKYQQSICSFEVSIIICHCSKLLSTKNIILTNWHDYILLFSLLLNFNYSKENRSEHYTCLKFSARLKLSQSLFRTNHKVIYKFSFRYELSSFLIFLNSLESLVPTLLSLSPDINHSSRTSY